MASHDAMRTGMSRNSVVPPRPQGRVVGRAVMSTDSETSVNPGTDAPKRASRLQTGVRTLIVLVACCAAVLWAWRHLSENYDPVRSEARSIQERAIGALRSGRPAERLAAIVELQRLCSED